MANTYATHTRMVVGYDSLIKPALVNTITYDHFTDADANTVENLRYPDPTLYCAPTTGFDSSNNPYINIAFYTSFDISCVGILNHNLYSAGYDDIQFRIGSGEYFPSLDLASARDRDIFLALNPVHSESSVRLYLKKDSGTRPAFRIGAIYVGESVLEVGQNPNDGLMQTSFQSQWLIGEGSGGERFLQNRQSNRQHTTNMVFQRLHHDDQVNLFAMLDQARRRDDYIGIKQPDVAGGYVPYSVQHLFGYPTKITHAPLSGYAGVTDHFANVTVTVEGV